MITRRVGHSDVVDFRDVRMTHLLEFARSRGVVLMDLPPLSDTANAKALAVYADAVVLVVVAKQTTLDALKQSANSLKSAGANVIGVVINRAKA